MDLNKQLNLLGEAAIAPREEAVRKTAAACRDRAFRRERERLMGRWEFLLLQLRYTRKRWWLLQAGLLALAMELIRFLGDRHSQVRSMGVLGCLFAVLMIPELWRNRETDSMQVEAACLYSLRQVYAARITLFGVVDVALLTVFSLGLGRMGFTLNEVAAHFLLPVTVTACICFFLLCGNANVRESVSLAACLLWGAVWWLVVMNEGVYLRILPSVWTGMFALAVALLALAVRRTLCTANQYWEVAFD